jgi:hypothetical protein
MLGWIRGGILGAIVCLSFAACGGDDFSSGDPGNADASVGGSGATGGSATGGSTAGGSAGTISTGGTGNTTADAAPEAPTNCGDPVAATACDQLSTGVTACDECGQNNCCNEVNACIADAACARALECYLENCFDQPATACMLANCQPCIGESLGPFTTMSGCLMDHCGVATGICPQFKS